MNTQSEKKRSAPLLRSWYVTAPALSAALGLVLLFVCAFALSRDLLSVDMMENCAVASVFLGATAGGTYAAVKSGRGVLVSGGVNGLIIAGLIALGAMLSPTGRLFSADCLKMMLCGLLGGIFGGALKLTGKGGRGITRRNRRRRI